MTDPPGGGGAPSHRSGVLRPEPRSEGDFSRLNCLSQNLSAIVVSPSCLTLLKIPPWQQTPPDGLHEVTVTKPTFLPLSPQQSLLGQSFVFLKSVTFRRSAERPTGISLNTREISAAQSATPVTPTGEPPSRCDPAPHGESHSPPPPQTPTCQPLSRSARIFLSLLGQTRARSPKALRHVRLYDTSGKHLSRRIKTL